MAYTEKTQYTEKSERELRKRLERLEKHYEHMEMARLDTFWEIQDIRRELFGKDAEAELKNGKTPYFEASVTPDGGIRIEIGDYLPNSRLYARKDLKTELRRYWTYIVVKALESLKEKPVFKGKVFCEIKVYFPANTSDPDNLNPKPLFDALRAANLIKDDSARWVAYSMDCDVDPERPRTVMVIRGYDRRN